MQKIAFIDDDNNVLESLKCLFNDEPYEIFAFNSPYKALEKIAEEKFAVVVSDQIMPETQGTTLLQCVKEKCPETECIIMTASSLKINKNRGNFQIIKKPWNIHELKQTISDAVARYEKKHPKQKDIQTKKNILYVENNLGVAKVIMEILKILGYEPTLTTKSSEAIQLLQAQPDFFDVIITDKNLEELNCFEHLGEFAKINPDIPVILCTGDCSVDIEKIKRTTGFREVLFKPFRAEELRDILNKILNKME